MIGSNETRVAPWPFHSDDNRQPLDICDRVGIFSHSTNVARQNREQLAVVYTRSGREIAQTVRSSARRIFETDGQLAEFLRF